MNVKKLAAPVGVLLGSFCLGLAIKSAVARMDPEPEVLPVCDMKIEEPNGTNGGGGLGQVPAAILASMPFDSPDIARNFIAENEREFVSAYRALGPHIAARLQTAKRCLGYDQHPHPLGEVSLEWRLSVSTRTLIASDFRLVRTPPDNTAAVKSCFDRAFSESIRLEGVPEPAASLSYNGIAPSHLTFKI